MQRRKEFREERKVFKKNLIFNMKKGKDFRIFTFFILKILVCFALKTWCSLREIYSFILAITSIPPLVLSPILQVISVSNGKKTSILEPNLMNPNS